MVGTHLTRRGFSVLLVDGPGMGESIRFRSIPLHGDYELVGTACLDYLETRPDVDMSRVGIVALSLGGYYAPRCVALDHRYKACVAWGAQWDVHAMWVGRLQAIEQGKHVALPVPVDHVRWVFGVDTFEQALEKLKVFRLDGVVQRMRCAFLLTHGTEDQRADERRAEIVRCRGIEGQDFPRVYTRGGGRAALPARLSHARV